jgi:hypothetical protein
LFPFFSFIHKNSRENFFAVIVSLEQTCATSSPRAACGLRNSLFLPTATTKALSWVAWIHRSSQSNQIQIYNRIIFWLWIKFSSIKNCSFFSFICLLFIQFDYVHSYQSSSFQNFSLIWKSFEKWTRCVQWN